MFILECLGKNREDSYLTVIGDEKNLFCPFTDTFSQAMILSGGRSLLSTLEALQLENLIESLPSLPIED